MVSSNSKEGTQKDVNVDEPNGTSDTETNSPTEFNSHSITTGSFFGQDVLPHKASNISSSRRAHSERIDFLQDPVRDMTWGRRLALKLASKAWYNPQARKKQQRKQQQEEEEEVVVETTVSTASSSATKKAVLNDAYPFSHATRETPSLEKAWAYFEHVALARFVVPEGKDSTRNKKSCLTRVIHRFQKGNKLLNRAEPGEQYQHTKLYKPVFTPHKQLGDFGLGIGLYFSTLRAIACLTLLVGFVNIANMVYFSSDEYSPNPQETVSQILLKGSAICTDTTWVPCANCSDSDFDSRRIEQARNDAGETLTFALKNNCIGATLQTGFVSYGALFLFVIGIGFLNNYLTRMEIAFDEDEQTAQDYSIVIENPPGDATEPEEWRRFFRENFDQAYATTCTIAVDNDLLVRSLVERREILRKIDMLVQPGTCLNTLTLARIAAKQERERTLMGRIMAMLFSGIPEHFARLVVLTAKIQGLAQQDYPASKIFVTFETETDQRRVLSALDVGSAAVKRNKTSAVVDPKQLFRGDLVLDVKEPDEPSTVRWQDLNETAWTRFKQQALTTFCTLAAVVVIALIVRLCHNASVTFSAFSIAIFNVLFPMFAKFLTNFESHASEGGIQRSLYFKIALFRFVNTAVVITIITPFTLTLENSGGLISQVYALFFAEIVTTNAIQLADPVGHLKRHFLAPRAKTQDAMNLCMQGQEYELAERYTNMTKILFLTVWYYSIYPGAMFMCAFALFVNYFTDRFSLMRTWKRASSLGPRISKFSRTFFFPLAILAMTIMSSYYWSGFPYDNLCAQGQTVSGDLVGTWFVGNTAITVDATDEEYAFCLQDFFRYNRDEPKFPFIPEFQREGEEWMTDDQETITNVWGWSSIGIIALIILKLLYGSWESIMGIFRGTYDARGKIQNINFSDASSISTYIPQVISGVFSYPLLACNMDDVDPELLEWDDPDKPLCYYDLTKDADVLLHGTDVSSKTVFSQIFHWPPNANSDAKSETKDGWFTPPGSVKSFDENL